MAHVPHLVVPGPWSADATLTVTTDQRRHIEAVLRRAAGSPVSYTDGSGIVGTGTWDGTDIIRGTEKQGAEACVALTIAVSPPDSRERLRWLVEKCTELGVGRIRWLRTEFGHTRLPRLDRTHAWMISAVEQSRRSRITIIDEDWSGLGDLENASVANPAGEPFFPSSPMTVAIGPAGGWADGEVADIPNYSLGPGILRTETAAVVVAGIVHAVVLE